MRTNKLMLALVLAVSCEWAAAQDAQSLGDVARQAKQQKQHSEGNTAQSSDPQKPSKSTHVVTNDEIPEAEDATNAAPPSGDILPLSPDKEQKRPADYWKSHILQTKRNIASLQHGIDALSSSIRFSQGNYEKHVDWNERQRRKQQEVENLKSQLDRLQKQLDELQEAARHQGYGSSVYEP
jgi:predicted RNase H-like nuclease (RuvC/YqgF family)